MRFKPYALFRRKSSPPAVAPTPAAATPAAQLPCGGNGTEHQGKMDRAAALHREGQMSAAQEILAELLASHPDHSEALNLSGVVSGQMAQFRQAVHYFDRALAVQPDNAAALLNRGIALSKLQDFESALSSIDRAIVQDRGNSVAHYMRGIILEALGQPAFALASYDHAMEADPRNAAVRLQRGNVLKHLHRLPEAVASYDGAISIRPDYAEAHSNKAGVQFTLGNVTEALDSYGRSIALAPSYAETYFNRAGVLRIAKQFEAAAADYATAAALKPEIAFLPGAALETKLQMCDWRDLDSAIALVLAGIDRDEPTVHPFPLLGFSDSPHVQKKATELWVRLTCPPNESLGPIPKRHCSGRIRIGYFSADYREHATTHLLAEMIELHDRQRFEIIAFSLGPNTQDASRQRHERAFDRFLDVQDKSNADIASLARHLQLDIAIDLCGHVHGGRPGIFAFRTAPLQVNYLGYPATTGSTYMDYIVADQTLVPPGSELGFTEKIIALPNSYQVNDRQRRIASTTPTRRELGLPEASFVYCCFNNNYKILPATFDIWMRILLRVPNSVLWLLGDTDAASRALQERAAGAGVLPQRLIFARRQPNAEHLARHRCADLFLDTLPCNAHTTASDALWAGLPVVTQMGESFASRVAASLLRAIQLPDLIASSKETYEELAVQLALSPQRLAEVRSRLDRHRLSAPLFDSRLFTRHLENAYVAIHERHSSGLAPDHMRFDNR